MLRRSVRLQNELTQLQNIREDCSGDESEQADAEEQSENQEYSSEDSDPSDSESDTENVATDGTQWVEIDPGGRPGRPFSSTPSSRPTAYACYKFENSPASAFKLLLDTSILDRICECTQIEANSSLNTKDWVISRAELLAFIGILFARGAYGSKLSVELLWSKKWGPGFFHDAMPRQRFRDIFKYLRFDEKLTRPDRLAQDKFALISEVWNRFIENSQKCYHPGSDLTIDEQLFPTKTRCPFLQYISSKPDKWGVKFWIAADVKTKYCCNAMPYLGRNENRPNEISLGEYVVTKLMEPYYSTGRNVCVDNFFTSLSLANRLKKENLTITGTMRLNKRELPLFAKQKKDTMPRYTSKLFKTQDKSCTLTVYKSKPKKKVLLLSSKHPAVRVETTGKKFPETIAYYNQNKVGVDVLDQMCKNYTVKTSSKRWPFHVFCNILDLAGVNAYILYKQLSGKEISRQKFIFELAEELILTYKAETAISNAPESTDTIAKLRSTTSKRKRESDNPEDRKTCQIGFCNKNKTKNRCIKCGKNVCGQCTQDLFSVCKNCTE